MNESSKVRTSEGAIAFYVKVRAGLGVLLQELFDAYNRTFSLVRVDRRGRVSV